MSADILIVLGHPDPAGAHFCHAIADAYRRGAETGGHAVEVIDCARLDIPFLRNEAEWETESGPDFVKGAQDSFLRATHVVLIYPLWLGTMPAVLKAFLEQVLRPGFAVSKDRQRGFLERPLSGRSARLIVTMGMPGLFYRLFYFAHSVKSLRRNILNFIGISPVRTTLVGSVGQLGVQKRQLFLEKFEALGRKGV